MKTLQDIAKRIEVLAGQDDLDDKEVKELETLNNEAAKMRAREEAQKNLSAAKAQADEEAKLETERAIAEAVKKERAKMEAESRRLMGGDAPYVTQFSDESKYDNMDAVDLSLFMDMQKTFKAKGVRYANGNEIEVAPAAFKAMARRVADMNAAKEPAKGNENPEDVRKSIDYVKNAFKAAAGYEPTVEAVDKAIKAATDPMYTGGSLIGSDWVGTAYSQELWRVIRAATPVANNIPAEIIPDGYSSKTVPLESTDLSWYKVAEATASDATLKVPAATIAASQIATANKNITVGKLGARGLYTQELEEDSLIRFAPQLRQQMQVSGAEILESLILDGDVETSANKNINDIAGTPAATDYFLICDGFRKLALVTTTANSLSAAGSLSIDDFLDTLKLMGTAGIAGADPNKAAFIVDGNVYYAMAKLPEVKTRDVNSAATVENGFVTRVWNVPVIASWQMHRAAADRKANTAGKIDVDTTANNTRGAVVAVRWDQWKQAYKRRFTLETTRIANADSWEIVGIARWGLAYRDAEASAVLYNVGV